MNRIKVENVMSNTYVVVDGLMTVAEGIVLAKQKQVKELIIKKRHDNDEYGIVLLSDIAKKVLMQNRSTERTNIYEIMTKPVLSVSPDMNIKYCAQLFERFGISRAPVLRHGEIVGVVSYNNIVLNGMTGFGY
ncbi:CBS domain-containing protein [Aliivibrio fischeri]|uniref:CBS domain-containing protein n=1 Tax=Aliivibrio fischeri TaxID=668 RepID=UPI0012D93BB2|nr:CBS domain-containing protein [Aliivibrio fischeri]MUJ20106.1 CBS domain-containing protein [Aliivibrio fischeri]MUK62174.1 CBS domain-containing protein [Aliivibrio fischeri]MUK70881.1 CBS domain-containing protein [Aliivibrio fischeri]MUK74840.1 CBS domain-containing protein [Aliivibrio fischeri]MUK75952.1 CBS domain-containing protein [Aliivibrio fischeri]